MQGLALHIPVMLDESTAYLVRDKKGTYIDATLGMGGYSRHILDNLDPEGRVFGFDVDEDALREARANLKDYPNFEAVESNFSRIKVQLAARGVRQVNGFVFDLGVSSLMLDKADKGFSYREDGPLDMRMDRQISITAADIINSYEKDELARIFRELGEERQSGRIAARIVKERQKTPFSRTGQLSSLVKSFVPEPYTNKSLSRIFQALRIEVNQELAVLEQALQQAVEILAPGGRLMVVSYHSLEDRIVKSLFRAESTDCICPSAQPVCTCTHQARLTLITRRSLKPTDSEQKENRRSRSARMRVAEKKAEVPA